MNSQLIELSGWLPAIIFPAATLIQLVSIFRTGSVKGVSPLAWVLFGVANFSVYIYTEKYLAVQMIVGFLGTAFLDFMIAAMAIEGRTPEKI